MEKTELGPACSGWVSFVCSEDAFGHPRGYLFWRISILNVAAMHLLINALSFVACCSLFLVLLVWALAPIGILRAYTIKVQTGIREQTLDLQVPFNKEGRLLAQLDSK